MGPAVAQEPFRQRWPWIGADLQTLRDSLRPRPVPLAPGERLLIPCSGGALLAWLSTPAVAPRALVLLVHGLGGCSDSIGVRRLAAVLLQHGLAVLRLNLRGAGAGRPLATGSYAAQCNADLLPVLDHCRDLAASVPLLGVGLSLGGTVLLNALLARPNGLDGLAALSAPLDLAGSCRQMERRRNRLYLPLVLQRLRRQVAADPAGLTPAEQHALAMAAPWSLTAFDRAITAPRWGYGSVEAYYAAASPLVGLQTRCLPPCLLLQAADDPWVPAAPAASLAREGLTVVLTPRGGHNGFHGAGDHAHPGTPASWADRLCVGWLLETLAVQVRKA